MTFSKKPTSETNAELIAIDAFSFIAQSPELFPRFLQLTGLSLDNIRQAATQPHFLEGVLNFLLQHEPSLLDFCHAYEHAPQSIQMAFLELNKEKSNV